MSRWAWNVNRSKKSKSNDKQIVTWHGIVRHGFSQPIPSTFHLPSPNLQLPPSLSFLTLSMTIHVFSWWNFLGAITATLFPSSRLLPQRSWWVFVDVPVDSCCFLNARLCLAFSLLFPTTGSASSPQLSHACCFLSELVIEGRKERRDQGASFKNKRETRVCYMVDLFRLFRAQK